MQAPRSSSATVIASWTVEGMDCADCATKLEQGVARLDGVLFCSVNFAGAKMRVEYDAERLDPEAVNKRVHKMGYGVRAAGVREAGQGSVSPTAAAGTRSCRPAGAAYAAGHATS